jgi:hypothetical protein
MSLLSRLAVQAARAYGILSSKAGVSVDYLVIAGGGGGGAPQNGGVRAAGGGGAGGYRTSAGTSGGGGAAESKLSLSTLNTYTIVVGAGGAGGVQGSADGSVGQNSVFSTITSAGGGYGGQTGGNVGGNGGSGGGSGNFNASTSTGTSGQGFAGSASGANGGSFDGGGGGGAGAVGTVNTGGAGVSSSIDGSATTRAVGGGVATSAGSGSNATSNTGNGGQGGKGSSTGTGGAGGSGIVIISYTSATPLFVGGTITTSGGKQIHTFTSSGTLSPITPITASYLVVAGGGGGGSSNGASAGGAGAGGLLTSSTTLYSGATYIVTVGAGGAGGAGGTNSQGIRGSSSSLAGTGLTTISPTGGGGGGAGSSGAGQSGGSGGGGGTNAGTGGAGTSGQGFAGGTAETGGNFRGGGGGGASAVGAAGTSGGTGGAGTASSITGSSITYAGGGGGGAFTGASGAGGAGGGGAGGTSSVPNGVPGTSGLGGGGGGTQIGTGGNGGSGVVIISYAGSQAFNGGLVTSSGGNTIHTFNATGALTPLTNNLTNSLRFRRSASGYLSRTPASASSRTTWTWSAWVKRGALGISAPLFASTAVNNDTNWFAMKFTTSDTISVEVYSGNVLVTTQVFRDPSAWYHITLAVDTTQATAANRVKLYINGNQVTAFSSSSYPSQNALYAINAAQSHVIGSYQPYASDNFDGYMDDINFIDGQALEPYYFGNNDANGVWKPIKYTGMYGTNGFYLTFADTTSTTTLGYDTSGNNNNWTTNNISLTAGVTYDAMLDVPTNTSATVANYPVLNPLTPTYASNISFANLRSTGSSSILSTISIPSTGSWYVELDTTTVVGFNFGFVFGLATESFSSVTSIRAATNRVTTNLGTVTLNSYSSIGSGNVVAIAYNATTGVVNYYRNNTLVGTVTGFSPTDPVFIRLGGDNAGDVLDINFGQRPFSYTPPTGFVRLNTFNLPTPTILQGNKYMDATLYTGNGSTQSIVNQGQFKPDLVWMKNRGSAQDNTLLDSIRGTTGFLISNWDGSQSTAGDLSISYNSNGFSTIGGNARSNTSSNTYVGWQWQAGQGSTSSNTSGSITTTTSVNATAGFSIVTFTGTGASASIGHGLGVAPKLMIFKQRNGTSNWNVLTNAGGSNQYGFLNLTTTFAAAGETWTSTVINIGANFTNGSTYVMYAWAEIAGFSKFGSYTGNGSADGPFVYTGFRPEFIMIKNSAGGATSSVQGWIMLDTSRSPFNQTADALFANNSNASNSSSTYGIDILSNGFKTRGTDGAVNESSATYIYMAFAENPFKNANAR